MNTKTILQEAEELVGGDRQQDYGDTRKSFGRIAALWSAYLGVPLTPKDVGMMMVLMKVSRGKESDKRDTIVDIAGYARCMEMLGQSQAQGPHSTDLSDWGPLEEKQSVQTDAIRVGQRHHCTYCKKGNCAHRFEVHGV